MSHKHLFPWVSTLLAIVLAVIGVVPVSADPPSNDDFASATVVTEPLPFTDSINTSEATTAADDPSCTGNATVWYQFTPSEDMVITANTFGSDYTTTVSAWVLAGDDLNQVECWIDEVLLTVTAGVTYYFVVATHDDEEPPFGGNLIFSVNDVPPPANDEITAATVVTEPLPFTDTVDVRGATTASDDPDCFGNALTVWYQYTPSQSMHIQVDTFGSNYDTELSVYTGPPGSLTQLRCERDAPIPYNDQAALTLDVVANQTYYFMVGAGFNSFGSERNLVFTVGPVGLVQAEIQVDPIGTVDREGNAIIRGTLTCSRPAVIESVGGTVQQTVGQRVIVAPFFLPLSDCGPEMGEIQWEVVTRPEDGRFKPGRVTVDVDESFFDVITDESDRVEFTQVVRLKRK